MSIELLELATECLGPLVGEVVFLGGATLALWITDPGAPPVRPTNDVDVLVEVTTRLAFHTFEDRLRSRCFSEDREDGVICRWRHRDSGLILDAMPDDPRVLGFESRWQGASIPHAVQHTLPSGATLRAVSPPYLLATKIEAFRSRGEDDFVASRDFGDIVTIIDGREELVMEVREADRGLRHYISESLSSLAADQRFREGIAAALRGEVASQARRETIVVPRVLELIEAANRGR